MCEPTPGSSAFRKVYLEGAIRQHCSCGQVVPEIVTASLCYTHYDVDATGYQGEPSSVDAGETVTKSDLPGDQREHSLPGGTGSADPGTDSSDPTELRALLAHARERLSFYEGFDRVIAENVRRSGELMLETLSMREQISAGVVQNDRLEHDRVLAGLSALDAGLDTMKVHLDSLAGQIADLRQSLGPEAIRPPRTDTGQTDTHEHPMPVSPDPLAPPSDSWESPKVIDVIAHHVPKAAIALSLQRYLGTLAPVVGVEAREFAEGVLRLQVTAKRPLDRTELTAWTEGGRVTVLQQQPTVIEIEIG